MKGISRSLLSFFTERLMDVAISVIKDGLNVHEVARISFSKHRWRVQHGEQGADVPLTCASPVDWTGVLRDALCKWVYEELRNLYSSPSAIRVIKSRRMRWAGYAARTGEMRDAYNILVGKREETTSKT
jgi:hypothetical protein